jgi:hypothetical protein
MADDYRVCLVLGSCILAQDAVAEACPPQVHQARSSPAENIVLAQKLSEYRRPARLQRRCSPPPGAELHDFISNQIIVQAVAAGAASVSCPADATRPTLRRST